MCCNRLLSGLVAPTQGAGPANVMQAVARMVSWVKVTKQISETEFPEHYLLSTLNALCLHPTGGSGKRTRCLSAQDKEALGKLAQCFSVDAAELASRTEELLPTAHREMHSNSTLTSAGAWRTALARTQQTSKQRKSFPVHAPCALSSSTMPLCLLPPAELRGTLVPPSETWGSSGAAHPLPKNGEWSCRWLMRRRAPRAGPLWPPLPGRFGLTPLVRHGQAA